MLCWCFTLLYSIIQTGFYWREAKVSSPALGKNYQLQAFFWFPTELILSAVADKKILYPIYENFNPLNSHERSNFKLKSRADFPFQRRHWSINNITRKTILALTADLRNKTSVDTITRKSHGLTKLLVYFSNFWVYHKNCKCERQILLERRIKYSELILHTLRS